MKIGDKVKVNINNTKAWYAEAIKSINGKTGTIVDVIEARTSIYVPSVPACNSYLVEFDEPLSKWNEQQTNITKLWFVEKNIEYYETK